MKRFLAIAALTAAILVTTALGATPSYIEFGIPVAKHLGGGAFWYERQQAELQFADTARCPVHPSSGRHGLSRGPGLGHRRSRHSHSSTGNWRHAAGPWRPRAATATSCRRAGCSNPNRSDNIRGLGITIPRPGPCWRCGRSAAALSKAFTSLSSPPIPRCSTVLPRASTRGPPQNKSGAPKDAADVSLQGGTLSAPSGRLPLRRWRRS